MVCLNLVLYRIFVVILLTNTGSQKFESEKGELNKENRKSKSIKRYADS